MEFQLLFGTSAGSSLFVRGVMESLLTKVQRETQPGSQAQGSKYWSTKAGITAPQTLASFFHPPLAGEPDPHSDLISLTTSTSSRMRRKRMFPLQSYQSNFQCEFQREKDPKSPPYRVKSFKKPVWMGSPWWAMTRCLSWLLYIPVDVIWAEKKSEKNQSMGTGISWRRWKGSKIGL